MVLARACLKAGIRGLVGKVCQDQHSPANYIETTSDSLKKTETFLVEMAELIKDLPEHLQLVEPVITPRFLPTCTTELMKGLAEISQRTGVRLQSKLATSLMIYILNLCSPYVRRTRRDGLLTLSIQWPNRARHLY